MVRVVSTATSPNNDERSTETVHRKNLLQGGLTPRGLAVFAALIGPLVFAGPVLAATTGSQTAPAAPSVQAAPAVPSVQAIGGMPATTPVSSLGSESAVVVAIAPAAQSQAIPITSAAEGRLSWLAAGHLQAMTLQDATVAYEIASLPLTQQATTGSGAVPNVSADISCGTTYEGVENSKHYSDLVGFAVVVDSGLTGFCNGPGHGAIVHWGNFLAGINNGIPDGCNAAGKPVFHHQGEDYNGSYPEWITTLNTFESGANTPIGCVGTGSDAAAALRVAYNGYTDSYDDWNIGWGQPGWGNQYFIAGPYTCCGTVTSG
jgi:hypothetical protein